MTGATLRDEVFFNQTVENVQGLLLREFDHANDAGGWCNILGYLFNRSSLNWRYRQRQQYYTQRTLDIQPFQKDIAFATGKPCTETIAPSRAATASHNARADPNHRGRSPHQRVER